jgi:hypothetical protein
MTSAQEFRRMALALEGTTEARHFDQTAFRVARTFATLAPDGLTANLKLLPDEQALKCLTAPEAFVPVPSKWGQQGWTVATLAALRPDELRGALELAWRQALPRRRERPAKPKTR